MRKSLRNRRPDLYPPRQWRSETQRGEGETLQVRYQVYRQAMREMNREPKTFDEWLAS